MNTTPDIRQGTILAVNNRDCSGSHRPKVSQALYCVSRMTTTQAIAIGEYNREIRIRLSDLKVVGRDYTYAAFASEAMQAKHAAEKAELARWEAAYSATGDLIGYPLHQLRLSTAQLEALAKAWTDIKAMS